MTKYRTIVGSISYGEGGLGWLNYASTDAREPTLTPSRGRDRIAILRHFPKGFFCSEPEYIPRANEEAA